MTRVLRKTGTRIGAPWIPCTEEDGVIVVSNSFQEHDKGPRMFCLKKTLQV